MKSDNLPRYWIFTGTGPVAGPFTVAAVASMVKRGEIPATAQVCPERGSQWGDAQTLAETWNRAVWISRGVKSAMLVVGLIVAFVVAFIVVREIVRVDARQRASAKMLDRSWEEQGIYTKTYSKPQ